MSAAINKKSMMEWLDPNEMHEASLKWMSELKFIRDEQLFLNDLVKAYTETHWELNSEMASYSIKYRELKTRLFKLVSKVLKKDKKNRLLN